ncbi:MAG: hypothetical protein IJK13_02085 [Lachnospiraceae bacterium]|nr:hypothetical protein [Lachnospiraceae bacterium]
MKCVIENNGEKREYRAVGKTTELMGVMLIIFAVALLLKHLGLDIPIFGGGFLQHFGLWHLILTLGCVFCFIKGAIDKSFGIMIFAVGICYCIIDKPLGLPQIGAFTMIAICAVIVFGLHLIFPNFKPNFGFKRVGDYDSDEAWEKNGTRDSSDEINHDSVFSSASRYIDSQNFSGYNGDIVFSSVNIYLDKAKLKDDKAIFNTDLVFSTLKLYVPRGWNVEVKGDSVFSGGVTTKGPKDPYVEGAPTIIVKGDRVFSHFEVIYV